MATATELEEEKRSGHHIVDPYIGEKESQIHVDRGSFSTGGDATTGAVRRLHPEPTTDKLDPLNWTRLQKHTILGIVMFKYVFLINEFPYIWD